MLDVKTNQYEGDSEPFGVTYSADDPLGQTGQGSQHDRAQHNRIFRVGNSSSSDVAAGIASRGPFPRRTLIVGFTIWLIATQVMIFDQLKFDERVHLLERETRSLGGPQAIIQNERQTNRSTSPKVQRL